MRITVTMDVMHVPLTQSSQSILFLLFTQVVFVSAGYIFAVFLSKEKQLLSLDFIPVIM